MDYGGNRKNWESTDSAVRVGRRLLLTTLLKRVSRSFYLSIRVLPSGMREPVAVAYLIARAADTIADSDSTPAKRRMAHLHEFRRLIVGSVDTSAPSKLSEATTDLHSTAAERLLLRKLPSLFILLNGLDDADAKAVRSVATTLTNGMLFDLRTFDPGDSVSASTLDSEEQLDEYCYLVAGCVGRFWTDISISHTASLAHWDAGEMRSLGVRFGKALQMTNILRDVPKDLRLGRCYLPQSQVESHGLRTDDLLISENSRRTRPLLAWGIRRALEHYCAAEDYILAIPRRNLRLRLAALWPVVIGLKTLDRLARSNDWLNPETRIRIPRRSVYGIIALSFLCGRSNALVRLWIRRIRISVAQSIQPD